MSLREERALDIVYTLRRVYPKAKCALNYRSPFQLLIATVLSAQTTDAKVNEVTSVLFKKYKDPAAIAGAKTTDVEAIVKSTGYYRNKTKLIQDASRTLIAEHGAKVPRTMEELTKLPGVGRKTANLVLSNAFDTAVGIVVDTHVRRLSDRLGLSRQNDPVKIEEDLMKLIPQEDWTFFSHAIILHGRQVCAARKPKCNECLLNEYCPSAKEPLE